MFKWIRSDEKRACLLRAAIYAAFSLGGIVVIAESGRWSGYGIAAIGLFGIIFNVRAAFASR